MSKKTIEQVRKLKSKVRKLEKKIGMYEVTIQRLRDYVAELVDENKKRKPRKTEVVTENRNPYGDILNTVLGNFTGIMKMFEEDKDETDK